MRKFVTLLAAAAVAAVPLSQSIAASEYVMMHKPAAQVQPTDTTGLWAVGCGFASFGSLLIGTEIKANDPDEKQRRQLTTTEASWHASACPVLLPLAFVAQATCPDNKGTYLVARLAWLHKAKHPTADQSAFTAAYGEACSTGNLSRDTRRALQRLI